MSRYGRDSEKQVFSYMDGIPVKISEQYKPPRKVVLPVGYQHRLPIETVAEEYDFKLEESVLQKMCEWRSLRKSAIANRKERIQAQERSWQQQTAKDHAVKSLEPTATTSQARTDGSSITYTNPTVSPVPTSFSTSSSTAQTLNGAYSSPSAMAFCETTCSNPYSRPVTSVSPAIYSICSQSSQNMLYTTPSTTRQMPYMATSTTTQQYSHPTSNILTPVPITPSSVESSTAKSSNIHFNFSDFEADTSSPFDNMELKTINEMEELAHVLQPLSTSHSDSKQLKQMDVPSDNPYASSVAVYNVDQMTLCNVFDSKLKKGPELLTHMNGLTAGYGFCNTVPRLKDQDNRNDGYINIIGGQAYNFPLSGTSALKNEGPYSFYSNQIWTPGSNISGHLESAYNPSSIKRNSNPSSAVVKESSTVHQALDRPQYAGMNPGSNFPSTSNTQISSNQDQHSNSGRSLSRSVPDIVQELEKELTSKRVEDKCATASRATSHTPPPRPNSFGSTGLENWKPWPDLDSPEPPQRSRKPAAENSSRRKPVTVSRLPNPFPDLSPALQQLAKHISEMGFALPRVARACQLLGQDDKKVVEYLLQVQSLEEKNYPGDRVETAMILNKFNLSQALKYLEAMAQLLDLGFPEDKVSDALIRSENDRDKALDLLIS